MGLVVLAGLLPLVQNSDPTYFFLKEVSPSLASTFSGSIIRSAMLFCLAYHWNVDATHVFYYMLCNDMLLRNARNLFRNLSQISINKGAVKFAFIPKPNKSWNQSKFLVQIQYYKTLRLLTSRINGALRWGLGISVMCGSIAFIISVSCLIHYFETLPITTLVVFFKFSILIQTAMFLAISPAGQFRHVSTEFLLQLQNNVSRIQYQSQRKGNQRIVRSMRPCAIQLGMFVNINKSSVVELSKILIEYTIDLLLFLQKM